MQNNADATKKSRGSAVHSWLLSAWTVHESFHNRFSDLNTLAINICFSYSEDATKFQMYSLSKVLDKWNQFLFFCCGLKAKMSVRLSINRTAFFLGGGEMLTSASVAQFRPFVWTHSFFSCAYCNMIEDHGLTAAWVLDGHCDVLKLSKMASLPKLVRWALSQHNHYAPPRCVLDDGVSWGHWQVGQEWARVHLILLPFVQ